PVTSCWPRTPPGRDTRAGPSTASPADVCSFRSTERVGRIAMPAKALKAKERDELLRTLQTRFEQHMHRHEGLDWAKVRAKLEANPAKLWSLGEMDRTGGEPDVVDCDEKRGEYLFVDCSADSPAGR